MTDNLVAARFFPDERYWTAMLGRFTDRYRLFNVRLSAKVTGEMPRTNSFSNLFASVKQLDRVGHILLNLCFPFLILSYVFT